MGGILETSGDTGERDKFMAEEGSRLASCVEKRKPNKQWNKFTVRKDGSLFWLESGLNRLQTCKTCTSTPELLSSKASRILPHSQHRQTRLYVSR